MITTINNSQTVNPSSTSNEAPVFVKFETYLLESIAARNFGSSEISILLTIVRLTTGFHRDTSLISLNGFENRTGIEKSNIPRVINELLDKRVISRKKNGYGYKYEVLPVLAWRVSLRSKEGFIPKQQFYDPSQSDEKLFQLAELERVGDGDNLGGLLPQQPLKKENKFKKPTTTNEIFSPSSNPPSGGEDGSSSSPSIKKEDQLTELQERLSKIEEQLANNPVAAKAPTSLEPSPVVAKAPAPVAPKPNPIVDPSPVVTAPTPAPVDPSPVAPKPNPIVDPSPVAAVPTDSSSKPTEPTPTLDLPKGLKEPHVTNFKKMLLNVENPQMFVDEIEPKLETINNPTGYLSSLIRLNEKGLFNPTAHMEKVERLEAAKRVQEKEQAEFEKKAIEDARSEDRERRIDDFIAGLSKQDLAAKQRTWLATLEPHSIPMKFYRADGFDSLIVKIKFRGWLLEQNNL